jgi:hypothetical protein
MNSLQKLQMYHEILDAMLASVVRLQSKGGVPFSFTYHGKQYNVNLKVFLMFIISDTKGHDKLCGRYNSQALQVKGAVLIVISQPRNVTMHSTHGGM